MWLGKLKIKKKCHWKMFAVMMFAVMMFAVMMFAAFYFHLCLWRQFLLFTSHGSSFQFVDELPKGFSHTQKKNCKWKISSRETTLICLFFFCLRQIFVMWKLLCFYVILFMWMCFDLNRWFLNMIFFKNSTWGRREQRHCPIWRSATYSWHDGVRAGER